MTAHWRVIVSIKFALLSTTLLTATTIGADAKQVSFDPQTGSAVFEIRNLSNKDITAFNVSTTAVYADGKTRNSERMVDLLPAMMSKIDAGNLSPGSGALHPGATQQERIGNPPSIGESNPLRSVDGLVDVVVYADGSGDIRNRAAFERIASERHARSNTIARVSRILSKHTDEQDPIRASKNDLQSLLSEAETHPQELESTEILATLDDLQHEPKDVTARDFLVRYADQKQKHVALAAASVPKE